MNRHPAVDWRATLRLQLHADFTLDDAREQVPYFARLGISHLYASPLLTAREGSMHGYDVVDPTRVSPALGGEDALRRLVAELRAHNMGLLLDFVSNHMAWAAPITRGGRMCWPGAGPARMRSFSTLSGIQPTRYWKGCYCCHF